MYTHVVVGLVTFKIVMHKIYSISSFSQLTNLIYNGTYTPQNENLTSCLLYDLCSFARSLAACVLCFYLFGCSHSHVSSQDRKFGTHPYFFKKNGVQIQSDNDSVCSSQPTTHRAALDHNQYAGRVWHVGPDRCSAFVVLWASSLARQWVPVSRDHQVEWTEASKACSY